MTGYHSFIRRMLVGTGLAAAVVGAAVLGGPAAGAQPVGPGADAPFEPVFAARASLSALRVLPQGGSAVWVEFTSSEPTTVVAFAAQRLPLAPVQPPAPSTASPPAGVVGGVVGDAVLSSPDTSTPASYVTQHRLPLTALTSNTSYQVQVAAATRSGQRLAAAVDFTTAKARVRIRLEQITIDDDGDFIGAGEPLWVAQVNWAGGTFNGCYPNNGAMCQYGSWGEGIIAPRNVAGRTLTWLFAEENFDTFPTAFTLAATVEEDDLIPGATILECVSELLSGGGCPFEGRGVMPPWQVPQGVEFASTPVSISVNDVHVGFSSTLHFTFELFYDGLDYPVIRRNIPQTTWWG